MAHQYHQYNHGHYALHTYPMAASSNPPGLLMSSAPLPDERLSALVVEDEPLPPVPFVNKLRELNRHLRWGTWRRLPKPCDPQLGLINELLGPATFPEQRQLIMEVNLAGHRSREVLIQPRGGASTVSVLDVINAVEIELQEAERRWPAEGAYRYIGQWVRRGRGGPWMWYGLAESKVESDVWVLHL